MNGVPVQVCAACGHAVFPARALCPACGVREWCTELATTGTVEQVTTHRGGGTIVSVRTALGPVVIARAGEGTAPGSAVVLGFVDGAPTAA